MTTTQQAVDLDRLNGINVLVLKKLLNDVKNERVTGLTKWAATTRWVTGAVTETEIGAFELNGKSVPRSFKFRTDEPHELAGGNAWANPQDYLLGAFNACMTVGYVALSTLYGIELESVEIETKGDIDLRGFLGLSKQVKPGYDSLHYTVRIKGNGTPEQFKEIHEIVKATSPNRFNISQPITLTADLIINEPN